MITSNKLTILLFASAVFFSCEKDPVEPVPTVVSDPHPTVLFNGSGQFTNIATRLVSYHPQVVLEVSLEGNGDSNLMPSFNIETSHQEETLQENNYWTLELGEFTISDDQGDSIYGKYSGYGNKLSSGSIGYWTLNIIGGTGRFTSANGTLSASVKSSHLEDDKFSITGRIAIPEESNL